MISLAKKKQTTDALDKALENAGSVFLADFSRIRVTSDVELRKALRKQGIYVRIAKNTLIKRALHKAGITALDTYLTKPTVILVGNAEDPVGPAKAMVEFQKANKGLLESKISYIDGDVFPGSSLVDVSKMPGKRELQAQVVQLFLSPGSTLVGLIKGPGSQVAGQIEALAKRLEEAA